MPFDITDEKLIDRIRENVSSLFGVKASDMATQMMFGGLPKLFAKQTADFDSNRVTPENHKLSIIWENIPNPVQSEFLGNTSLIGSAGQISANIEDVIIDNPVKYTLAGIPIENLNRNGTNPDKYISKSLYAGLVAIARAMAAKFYTKLYQNLHKTKFDVEDITWDEVTKSHVVTPAVWNDKPELIARIVRFIAANNVQNPTIIGGQTFVREALVAQTNAKNANGAGNDKAFSMIDYVDGGSPMMGVDTHPNSMVLLSGDSYAIFDKTFFDEPASDEGNGHKFYTSWIPSKFIPGVGLDYRYAIEITQVLKEGKTMSIKMYNSDLMNWFDVFFRKPEMKYGFGSNFRFVKGA